MTGPEHYAAAEEHLDHAASIETDGHDDSKSAWHQRQAQAHATLAMAAAAAEAFVPSVHFEPWAAVIRLCGPT